MYLSGGTKNFRNGPGPDAVEFSRDCFDAPSQTSHALVVRVENKIHIVEIECGLQLKYMHFMHSKYTQIKRKLKGEGGHLVRRSWIIVCKRSVVNINLTCIY